MVLAPPPSSSSSSSSSSFHSATLPSPSPSPSSPSPSPSPSPAVISSSLSRRHGRPAPLSKLHSRPHTQFRTNMLLLPWSSCISSSRFISFVVHSHELRQKPRTRNSFLSVRADLGGQYEDNFADVDKHLLDYFTYKAVRTVLVQLYEMNPTQYAWFYNFVVNNKPQDSKLFLRTLVQEKQELCERVMVTRLHLYNKWIKKHDHSKMYQAISDQNLELLRERLVQTVKWSDSENTDKT